MPKGRGRFRAKYGDFRAIAGNNAGTSLLAKQSPAEAVRIAAMETPVGWRCMSLGLPSV